MASEIPTLTADGKMDSEDDKFDSELCEVYQLRISIIGSKPWVWRRIHISEASELTDLGTAILKSVGWWNGENSFELQCKFLKREAEDRFFEAGSDPEGKDRVGTGILRISVFYGVFALRIFDVEMFSHYVAELGIDCTIRTLFEKWGNPIRFHCGNEGHNWLHLVTREKRIARDPKRIYPACIRGN